MGKRFNGSEQFVGVQHSKHTGSSYRGVINNVEGIAAAGVSFGRFSAFGCTTAF